MATDHIRAHTGMRGIAAVLVVGHHYRHTLVPAVDLDRWTHLFAGAGAFVDLFFMLSGFVMIATYRDLFAGGVHAGDARDFLIKRIARIYPLHLLTLAVMLALAAIWATPPTPGDLLENIAMVQAWGMNDVYVLNYPSWSISAEFWLYLLCPLLILVVVRRSGALLAVALIAGAYLWLFTRGNGLELDERFSLVRALPAFLLGLLLYERRAVTLLWPGWLLATIQLLSVAVIALSLHRAPADSVVVLCFSLLILTTWQDRGPVAAALRARPVLWLGLLSYSVYLLHVPARQAGYVVIGKIGGTGDPVLDAVIFTAGCTVVTLILAHLCYHRFEMPARRLISARARGRMAAHSTRTMGQRPWH